MESAIGSKTSQTIKKSMENILTGSKRKHNLFEDLFPDFHCTVYKD